MINICTLEKNSNCTFSRLKIHYCGLIAVYKALGLEIIIYIANINLFSNIPQGCAREGGGGGFNTSTSIIRYVANQESVANQVFVTNKVFIANTLYIANQVFINNPVFVWKNKLRMHPWSYKQNICYQKVFVCFIVSLFNTENSM